MEQIPHYFIVDGHPETDRDSLKKLNFKSVINYNNPKIEIKQEFASPFTNLNMTLGEVSSSESRSHSMN